MQRRTSGRALRTRASSVDAAASPAQPDAEKKPIPKPKRRGRALPLGGSKNPPSPPPAAAIPGEAEPASSDSLAKATDADAAALPSQDVPPSLSPTITEKPPNQGNDDDDDFEDETLIITPPVYLKATRKVSPDEDIVINVKVTYSDTGGKLVGHDGNQFFCAICHLGGNVLCCDGCPKVYHEACLPEPPSGGNDTDPWYCPSCITSQHSPGGTKKVSGAVPTTRTRRSSMKDDSRGHDDEEEDLTGEEPSPSAITPARRKRALEEEDEEMLDDSQRDDLSDQFADADGEEEDAEEEEEDEEMEEPGKLEFVRGIVLTIPTDDGRKPTRTSPILVGDGRKPTRTGIEIIIPSRDGITPTRTPRKRSNSESSGKKKKKSLFGLRRPKKKSKKSSTKTSAKKRAKTLGQIHEDEIMDESSPASQNQASSVRNYSTNSKSRGGLVQATPAFFFFLADNRSKLDRVLARKHRYFNRLPKGMERNELIAKEGARWWIKLRLSEQKRYFTMSMRDFEQKVIEWKEDKTIREMLAFGSGGEEEQDAEDSFSDNADTTNMGQDDEATVYKRHQKLYLGTSVGYKTFQPEPGKSNNRVLLELLQDMRFNPIPMFDPHRSDGVQDSGLVDRTRSTIPYFDVRGPLSTSVGDECSGCSRGWNHYCPVLKRRIPAIEIRAILQPPMSSLLATRVGLGLKETLAKPADFNWQHTEADLFVPRDTIQELEAKLVPPIPCLPLTEPSNRTDDVVNFVEECLAMKVPEPVRPLAPNTKAKRGRAAIRQGRLGEDRYDSAYGQDIHALKKCGRCRTIICTDTGCVPCRRAQLVINTSKRPGPGQAQVMGKKEKNPVVTVQTTMLGRLTAKDNNFEAQKEGDRTIADAIVKHKWAPSAILPCATEPVPLPFEEESEQEEIIPSTTTGDKDSTAEKMVDVDKEVETISEEGEAGSAMIDESVDKSVAEGEERPRRRPTRNMRLLSAAVAVASGEDMDVKMTPCRQEIAKEHKEEAAELAKRCLNIACCGILHAMIRRDPLCLFAEPVPNSVVGYSLVVKHPIDFGKIKTKVQKEKYSSFSSFVADCKLLCSNALAFNPPGTIYAKTAKELDGVLEAMSKRGQKWIAAIKDCHSSYFARRGHVASDDDAERDPFANLRQSWPEAVDMLENGEWMRAQIFSDFIRTKENESAYYGSIAVRRAAIAAEATLTPYLDSSGAFNMVVNRSDVEDENLRKIVDRKVARIEAPIQLKDVPDWREENVIRILRRVQNRRTEGSVMSENGCARCEPMPVGGEHKNVNKAEEMRRKSGNKRGKGGDIPRIAPSRISLTTGLASQKARERIGRDLDGSHFVVKSPEKPDKMKDDEEGEDDEDAASQDEAVAEPVTEEDKEETDVKMQIDGEITEEKAAQMAVEGEEKGEKADQIPADGESLDQKVVAVKEEQDEKVTVVEEEQDEKMPAVEAEMPPVDEARPVAKEAEMDGVSAVASETDKWDKVNDVAVNVQGSEIHGWGLFAHQPFSKGDVVAEYVGEYVSNAVADAREKMYQERRIQDYQFRVDEHVVIDATLKGGRGRYINHNCNPSCMSKLVDGKPPNTHLKRLIIIAARDIKAREEITYDYQFPLEFDLEARIPCNCGSLLCRGFMNWDLPEKGSKNRVVRTQKRGGNMRDRIRRLGRPLKKNDL